MKYPKSSTENPWMHAYLWDCSPIKHLSSEESKTNLLFGIVTESDSLKHQMQNLDLMDSQYLLVMLYFISHCQKTLCKNVAFFVHQVCKQEESMLSMPAYTSMKACKHNNCNYLFVNLLHCELLKRKVSLYPQHIMGY